MTDEVGVLQLPRRDVDRHRDLTTHVLVQHRAVATRLLQDPFAERHDQSGLLGEWDELERRDRPLGRVLPAKQGFIAGDLIRLEIDHRLVVERELPELDRFAQLDHTP